MSKLASSSDSQPLSGGRQFLKSGDWRQINDPHYETDQRKGVPAPAAQKPVPEGTQRIDLVDPEAISIGRMPLYEAIKLRRSRRRFNAETLTLEELSYLLWATQGVREVHRGGTFTLRTVPSGGARHAFETYLIVSRVEGLEPGLYRYLALEHKLVQLTRATDLAARAAEACCGQVSIAESAVFFIWAALPYRMEWRYREVAHKVIALDAGHVCQNLYLAAESIGAGTCAIGAYHQDAIDALLGLDGEDEFVIYCAPVGHPA